MKKAKLKLLFQHFRSEGLSLRRRFLLYISSAIATLLAMTMVLLNLFGFLNPASVQIMRDLENQLTASTDSIERDCDCFVREL